MAVMEGAAHQGALFEICGLTKSFDRHRALSNVSFTIGKREVFGILGPNGAGKTTLVRHLVGFSRGDSGRVYFLGRSIAPPARWMRGYVGYMPQAAAALNHMTCEQALYYTARIRGLTRAEAQHAADQLLDLWEIADRRRSDSATLSGGETRLLRLAVTMIGDPNVLVLDEPTAHMDARYRRRVHRILAELSKTTTIVIVTHDVREASSILDRAVLLSGGRLQAIGSPKQLRDSVGPLFAVHATSVESQAQNVLELLELRQIDEDQWNGLVDERDLERLRQLQADGRLSLTSTPATLEEVTVGLAT